MGLVFGDIGTSPIYTLSVIILFIKPTEANIIGVLSLIIWTLIILVSLEYAWLAMRLEDHGEGGTIILKKILEKSMKKGRGAAIVSILTYAGVSLLLGDGVITPAISILSAVEGLALIPVFTNIHQAHIIIISVLITVGLFFFQPRGTDKVSAIFGPVMVIWFMALAVSGAFSLYHYPSVVKAINPVYFIIFFKNNGFAGFLILSEVILCATGAEALYADMGHLGKKPIVRAWRIIFFALVLTYLGQGAFILTHEPAKNVLFSMVHSESAFIYIPFLIVAIFATIIASQALISGVFSVIYQGITTRIFPRMKVDFTSTKLKSQIYIGGVNWILMIAVIFIMLLFRKSEKLAAAYGLAVTGTMCITAIMMILIYYIRKERLSCAAAAIIFFINLSFLIANFSKFSHGGYWSILLASIPFTIIIIWQKGNKRIYEQLMPTDFETFIVSYEQIYKKGRVIPGTCLFFVGNYKVISPYVTHCIVSANIIYETNIFIIVTITDDPVGIQTRFINDIGPGLHVFEIRAGYKEEIDITNEIAKAGIKPKVIFYGTEEITTKNVFWKIYSVIKKLTPHFVQFYRLPLTKLHGIVTRVEM
ncbi:MAG TPA: KUP/HAK/KT family potassium transporter [Spirochaetota bacterium]|nr:KUP/HAK/KT family potassium transporter [Spirochaetota bacterium]HPS87826.1 KUP/HAK/KT family potassium transporter [Spirochaetota bacterium]